jgi:hypothetical protein
MMNEFYELKPSETVENVRRYNSDAVLLADLPKPVNFKSGEDIEIPILLSNYGAAIDNADLKIAITCDGSCIFEKEIPSIYAPSGEITELFILKTKLPEISSPKKLMILAKLVTDKTATENEWDIYAFPTPEKEISKNPITVSRGMDVSELISRLSSDERVVLYGKSPLPSEPISFQISLAGRTNGHLATVVNDHPITKKLPHDGFLGIQFEELFGNAEAVILDSQDTPFKPIIEAATAYKNAHKEALLFEYSVGKGKLIVCSLDLDGSNPLSLWMKQEIENYASGDGFEPRISITENELLEIIGATVKKSEENTNLAFNKNDVTAN